MRIAAAALALLVASGRPAGATPQDLSGWITLRTWQVQPDGSRILTGSGASGGVGTDFKVMIRPTGLARRVQLRFDADMVVHRLGDSTVVAADMLAARFLSPTPVIGADAVAGDSMATEASEALVMVLRGQSAWLYPYGVPQRGERGLALEIAVSDRPPPPAPGVAWDSSLVPGNIVIVSGARPHQADVRIEVRERAGWRRVFNGRALTRIPVGMEVGPNKRTLSFILLPPDLGVAWRPGDPVCWRWRWSGREDPASTVSCAVPRGRAIVQELYGSERPTLRVTLRSAR